jgi:hypothetical protein
MKYNFIAQDQYGEVKFLEKNPRKELMEYHGTQHANKMYVGDGKHVGYVVSGHWYTIFALKDWKE